MIPAVPGAAPAPSALRTELMRQMPLFKRALFFGAVANLLVLGPTVYMLEVYDRVLNSRNETTLWMLLGLVIGVYVLMEALELVRNEILSRVGRRVDEALRARLFDAAFLVSMARGGAANTQAFNDLRTVREFIASPAAAAMMEVPTALVFLVIVFWIGPLLGVLALVGALVQVWITYRTERQTMPSLTEANKAAIEAQNYAGGTLRSTQVIEAMGMLGAIRERWMRMQRRFLAQQAVASHHAGANNAIGRFIQTLQGSVLLGASCWMALQPGGLSMTGGTMIVASTLGGRVLSPLVQLVAQWRLVVNGRDAYGRLTRLLAAMPVPPKTMPLPAPRGQLTVEGVMAAAPGTTLPILRGVSFAAMPGEVLMVLGPSAAGKSTLARLMIGVWPAASGKVRLDGADVFTWNKEELGPHIGYLPQGVELFDGTLAENIARFGSPDVQQVQAAGTLVGLDSLVAELPDGYDTRIGEDGAFLSGGQRQRVALARALYGGPRFIVLDEPNSSLDEAGEQALLQTLMRLKAEGRTVIVISHRTSILPAIDKMLLMRDGQVAAFGPRDEVLAQLQKAAQAAAARAGGAPVATAPVAQGASA